MGGGSLLCAEEEQQQLLAEGSFMNFFASCASSHGLMMMYPLKGGGEGKSRKTMMSLWVHLVAAAVAAADAGTLLHKLRLSHAIRTILYKLLPWSLAIPTTALTRIEEL